MLKLSSGFGTSPESAAVLGSLPGAISGSILRCACTSKYAGIAQVVEHLIRNEEVRSSSLRSGTKFACICTRE